MTLFWGGELEVGINERHIMKKEQNWGEKYGKELEQCRKTSWKFFKKILLPHNNAALLES